MAKVAPVGYITGIGEKMNHPFQIGDLVRSTMNPENTAIIVKTLRDRNVSFWVDAKYLRSGVVVQWLPISRFTLLSR